MQNFVKTSGIVQSENVVKTHGVSVSGVQGSGGGHHRHPDDHGHDHDHDHDHNHDHDHDHDHDHGHGHGHEEDGEELAALIKSFGVAVLGKVPF